MAESTDREDKTCEPRLQIDIDDRADADRWAKKLGVAPEVLAQAVKTAGPCADDVAALLAKRSAEGPSS